MNSAAPLSPSATVSPEGKTGLFEILPGEVEISGLELLSEGSSHEQVDSDENGNEELSFDMATLDDSFAADSYELNRRRSRIVPTVMNRHRIQSLEQEILSVSFLSDECEDSFCDSFAADSYQLHKGRHQVNSCVQARRMQRRSSQSSSICTEEQEDSFASSPRQAGRRSSLGNVLYGTKQQQPRRLSCGEYEIQKRSMFLPSMSLSVSMHSKDSLLDKTLNSSTHHNTVMSQPRKATGGAGRAA